MLQKKPVILILVISIMMLLISILTIVYLRNNNEVTENIKKTDSKNRETLNFSKGEKKKKSKRMRREKKKKKSVERILSKIKLSESQKLQIKEIKKERLPQKEKRTKMKELRRKLKQSFKDNTSQEDLLSLHGQIQSLKTQIASNEFRYILKIRKILNSKQRKKFQRLRKKYKHRFKKKKSRF